MRQRSVRNSRHVTSQHLFPFACVLTRYPIIAAITLRIPKVSCPQILGKTLRLTARAFRSALRLPSTCVVQFIGVRALIGRDVARAPPGLSRNSRGNNHTQEKRSPYLVPCPVTFTLCVNNGTRMHACPVTSRRE